MGEGVSGVAQQRDLGVVAYPVWSRVLEVSLVPANTLPQPCAHPVGKVTG